MATVGALEDTIVALATPLSEGALGIVRLSGSRAVAIADSVFLAKNKKPLVSLRSYRLRYGWIVRDKERPGACGAESVLRQGVVDEAIVSLMRAPHSYTREDVVEISSHGGPRVLHIILGLALEKGARLALPGEFTKRAFLNGRIDLAQAEAVMDIIRAKGDLALEAGLRQLSGDISRCVGEFRKALLDILADMEASVDFPEDVSCDIPSGERLSPDGIQGRRGDPKDKARGLPKDVWPQRLSAIAQRLREASERGLRGRLIREGLRVVIFGRPNVGKSSLLNALLRHDRAIVTPLAGTTRDTLEECVNIRGLAVCLVDTAGWPTDAAAGAARDAIESEALKRTQEAIETSDLVLFVLDASEGILDEDKILAERISGKKKICVINKTDAGRRIAQGEAQRLWGVPAVAVSAQTGENIPALEEAVFSSAPDISFSWGEGAVVANMRHIEIFGWAAAALDAAVGSLKAALPPEFAALDVKKALDALGEITGETFSEGLLDAIFSKFCIGK